LIVRGTALEMNPRPGFRAPDSAVYCCLFHPCVEGVEVGESGALSSDSTLFLCTDSHKHSPANSQETTCLSILLKEFSFDCVNFP